MHAILWVLGHDSQEFFNYIKAILLYFITQLFKVSSDDSVKEYDLSIKVFYCLILYYI